MNLIYSDIFKTNEIISMKDWETSFFSGNKNKQWKDNKSAKETANLWINGVPQKFSELFKKNPIDIELILPEHETSLDNLRGMGRVHDLLVIAKERNNNNKLVIGIESKVNEPFGNETVSHYYFRKHLHGLAGENTNIPERISIMIQGLFKNPKNELISDLRYQLLTSISGTLIEAKKHSAKKAIFIIQTLLTDKMDSYQHHINQIEIDKLINVISNGKNKILQNDEILGPFKVPGNENKFEDPNKGLIPKKIELYIGKIEIKILK